MPLLVYDGDCAFCTTWVRRLEQALPVYPATTPWQWADLDGLGLSRQEVDAYAWLLTPTQRFRGHLVLSALLRMQPRAGLRFIGHLLAAPPCSWVTAAGYAVIARFRHRLPGGTPACAAPRPDA